MTFLASDEDEEMLPLPEANLPNMDMSDALRLSSEDLPSVEDPFDDAAKMQVKVEETQEGYRLRNVGLYVGFRFK